MLCSLSALQKNIFGKKQKMRHNQLICRTFVKHNLTQTYQPN
jgi:hypothetical protein